MRYVQFLVLAITLVVCSGCLLATPYLVRRAVVHDDVILVKETNKLYRRYIPKGVLLTPNTEVIDQVGHITNTNDKIVVFGSYEKAVESGIKFEETESIKHYLEQKANKPVHQQEDEE